MTMKWSKEVWDGIQPVKPKSDERKRRSKANKELDIYFKSLPDGLTETLWEGGGAIAQAVEDNGFAFEEGFDFRHVGYGQSVRYNEQVGPNTWLSISVYRPESGRYEWVCYFS